MFVRSLHQFLRFGRLRIVCGMLVLTISLISSFPAEAIDSLPFSGNPLLATVDDEPVHLEDIKNSQIHDAMVNLHAMQERALKETLIKKLAVKHPELATKSPPQITPKAITEFYNTTPGVKELGTFGDMQKEIGEYLERSSRDAYIEQEFQHALEKGWVKVFLKPPMDFKLVADVGTAVLWFRGAAHKNKRVFLLEYSDFQCPFCKRVQPTLEKLRKRYKKEVQFGYRHFPLPFHKDAKFFAEAVECAGEQNRFWELQSLLYKESDFATLDNVSEYARRAGVRNLKDFQTCLDAGRYRAKVLADIREGTHLGIQGTPTFVLGLYDPDAGTVTGEMMSGAVSEEGFRKILEKYIATSHAHAGTQ